MKKAKMYRILEVPQNGFTLNNRGVKIADFVRFMDAYRAIEVLTFNMPDRLFSIITISSREIHIIAHNGDIQSNCFDPDRYMKRNTDVTKYIKQAINAKKA